MKNKTKIILELGFIFISMFILNMITPLIMDDFNYTYGLDGRINSIKDIANYQKWFYFNWGGRNIAHFIAQFFLMNNKILFNILNAGVYTFMIFLIYSIIKGTKKDQPSYLILIHLLLWFLTPAFGQSFIWLTGSCNYLWTTTIVLLFIKLFISISESQQRYNVFQIVLFGILGVLAGWTNENSGASLVFMLSTYIIFTKIIDKRKIKKIQLSGLIGVVLGFIIMIVAPGNFVRGSGLEENTFFLIKWIERAVEITQTAGHFLFILITIAIILFTIHLYKKQKINYKVWIFVIGVIIATYSMIVSPTFPERSWTIVVVYMTIICGFLLYNLNIEERLKKNIIIDSIVILCFLFINSYLLTLKDSYHFYNTWQDRIETINEGKKKNIEHYEFSPVYTTRKQSASYGLGDLYPNKKDSNNMTYARYFGIKSIKAK